MATRMLTKKTDVALRAARKEWLRVVHELGNEVSAWARAEPGWTVSPPVYAEVDDGPLGIYAAPVVTIRSANGGRLVLEPIEYWPNPKVETGLEGMVDLYALPTAFRVRLFYGVPGYKWQVMTESRVPLRQEWNRDNFIRLAKDLLAAEP